MKREKGISEDLIKNDVPAANQLTDSHSICFEGGGGIKGMHAIADARHARRYSAGKCFGHD